MRQRNWPARIALLALVIAAAAVIAGPAWAAGPSVASIYTSVNPATAGQNVTFNVVVEGTFQSPLGLVQLFDGLSPLGPPLVLSPDFDSVLGGPKIIPTDHSTATLTRSFTQGTHLITVDYTGDGPLGNLPIFGGGLISLVVTGAQSSTSVSSSVNPSVYGQSVTYTAVATTGGSPAAGTIQFKQDGANLGAPQTVSSSGSASVVASGLSVGAHTVSANFTSSDPNVLDSSGALAGGPILLTGLQLVTAADTATGVTSSANPSEFGAGVTFTSTTTVTAPGGGTPTGSVQFSDNGATLGAPQPVDAAAGQATLPTTSLTVGAHTISAVFTSATANFNGSSGSVNQTVSKAHTSLTYNGATAADYNDTAALSATLTRTDNGAPLAGMSVVLTMGAESCTQTTDAAGKAACTITPTEAAGLQTASAAFAGTGNYQASNDSRAFTVGKEETTTTYTGPTVVLAGSSGATLSAQLVQDGANDTDGDPAPATASPSGQTITFTLGGQSCSATTSPSGSASCTIASVSASTLGPSTVTTVSAPDSYYLGSSHSDAVIVFSFPSRGAFVLGDTSAATTAATMNWWNDSWGQVNILTGGIAPSSFKGFAAAVATLPTTSPATSCGATFTTAPGNSAPPTSTVPAYMGLLVASSVVQSASTISGTWSKIVVVRTGPGYAPSPGHPGIGTIVATFCG